MTTTPSFQAALDFLEAQREQGLHDGAQLYVSRHGETLLDHAMGESTPGRDLRVDDLMLWYSSSKPATAAATLQLWEQGKLGLDDLVADYVDGWGAGKERCTIRHVLTHRGGFGMYKEGVGDSPLPYAEKVAAIAAHPAEYTPGTKAGYHLTTGWTILGAIIEAVDGRPVKRYVEEEVFGPAGMAHCRLGVSVEEQAALGDRMVPVRWKGHQMTAVRDGRIVPIDYNIEERGHNAPEYRARVEPGSSGQGPARELGRFYESLLGFGPQLLEPRTVEVMIATHRSGMRDATFGGMKVPWGLGVQVSGGITGGVGTRAFGHGGLGSSRGLADPEAGLVMVLITNGLPKPIENEQRLFEITDAVYSAFGDELSVIRRPGRAPKELGQDVAFSS